MHQFKSIIILDGYTSYMISYGVCQEIEKGDLLYIKKKKKFLIVIVKGL